MTRLVCVLGLVAFAIGAALGGPGLSAAAEGPDQAVNGAASPPGIAQLQALFDSRRFQDVVEQGPAVLASVEREHGADSLEAAEVIDILVQARSRMGKAGDPTTTTLAERGVAIRENRLGPDDPLVAASLTSYGMILVETDRYDAARQALERALAVRESAFGPKDPRVADTLVELGRAQLHLGKGDAAQQSWTRALSIRKAAYGPDDLRLIDVLGYLGVRAFSQGDQQAAAELVRERLRILEAAGGEDLPEMADALVSQGLIHQRGSDYGAALTQYERALEIQRRTLPASHPVIASTLLNMGTAWLLSGEPTRAVAAWEEAAALLEATLGPESADVGDVLSNLGVGHLYLGDLEAARAVLERSLTIREKVYGPEHKLVASTLLNLSNVLLPLGETERATVLLQRALAISERELGPNHLSVAKILFRLGDAMADSGHAAEAVPLIERALVIREQAGGPQSFEFAEGLYAHLGRALVLAGRYEDARPVYERALAIYRAQVGNAHALLEQPLEGLAFVLERSGDRAGALDAAIQAQQLSSEHIRLAVASMTEGEALRYAARQVTTSDMILSLVARGGGAGDVGRAWETMLRARSLVLDEMIERRQATSPAWDEATAAAYRSLEHTRKDLAALLLQSTQDSGEKFEIELKKLRDADVAAERALAERSARFRERQGAATVSLDDVRRALPADAALVAYYRYEDIPESAPSKPGEAPELPRSTISYLAFVMRAGSADPLVLRLGPASAVEEAVVNWVKEISRAAANPARSDASHSRNVARKLKALAWDPIATQLGAARTVFIVPDGALYRVNFATLPAGRGRYLLESGPRLHHLSAERELVRPGRSAVAASGMLAMGNPAFDALPATLPGPAVVAADIVGAQGVGVGSVFRGPRSRCARLASFTFEGLPSAGTEVREVAAAWRKTAGESTAVVLTGTDATEAAFKLLAPGRQVVHLASHGFFLDTDCTSALDLPCPESCPWAPGIRTDPHAENPLLLSGIALAGANKRESAPPDGEDGVLTAEEVGALDLSGTEWVVLSGCDTGIGAMRSGEGVLGLSRAFRVAGARTLVLSLWPVDDESARQWMRALYDLHFVQGRSTVDAVRGASLDVLERRRAAGKSTHPLFWGGFIATGDWR